jgi:pimeloyl-ACP methyl ester carboxylesterase
MTRTGPLMQEMLEEVAEQVTGVRIPRTGHWVPEENPEALTTALLEFLGATEHGREPA